MALARTKEHGTRTRIRLERSELFIDRGLIHAISGGTSVIVGQAPRGVLPDMGQRLIITSKEIHVERGRITTMCSCCRSILPLEEIGLRTMPNGDIRNQPQCPLCRRLSVEEREAVRRCQARRVVPRDAFDLPRQRIAPRVRESLTTAPLLGAQNNDEEYEVAPQQLVVEGCYDFLLAGNS